MPGAFKPVEDVGASGVVDLIKGMSVGLLDGHSVADKHTIHTSLWFQHSISFGMYFCRWYSDIHLPSNKLHFELSINNSSQGTAALIILDSF